MTIKADTYQYPFISKFNLLLPMIKLITITNK